MLRIFATGILLTGILFITCTYTEEISHNNCSGVDQSQCSIHLVTVDPCKEAAAKQPCKIKRGKSAIISFLYTPNFNSETLHTRAYWVTGAGELPFVDMNTNGCKATVCPAVSGAQQNYTYVVDIKKLYPKGIFNLKWKLWGEDEKHQTCCFMFKIKVM